MCGICGVFEYASSVRVDPQRLARMNATLLHRGPDEEGFFVRDRVGLAMRRLRIIDLAGGTQPIANEDETDGHLVLINDGSRVTMPELTIETGAPALVPQNAPFGTEGAETHQQVPRT
jgi:asparagine synthase (glutamine-hydrolysing)